SIWFTTHRDVHPEGARMDEVLADMIAYAGAIKTADAGALVLGPEEWRWSGYFYSGYDQQWGAAHDWSSLSDRAGLAIDLAERDYAARRCLPGRVECGHHGAAAEHHAGCSHLLKQRAASPRGESLMNTPRRTRVRLFRSVTTKTALTARRCG
ncbi:MAG TPA: glycoside hydrolase family 44 protein, partial [Thermoanaerobaculia bacterium]|nr:glycoside hydrolase family 44 protein [Thermoanaerobaculia bacterium]